MCVYVWDANGTALGAFSRETRLGQLVSWLGLLWLTLALVGVSCSGLFRADFEAQAMLELDACALVRLLTLVWVFESTIELKIQLTNY